MGQKIQKRHVLPLSLTLVTKIILEESFNSNDYLTVASLVELAKANNVKILEAARSDLKIDLTDGRVKNRAPYSSAFSFVDELPFLNRHVAYTVLGA